MILLYINKIQKILIIIINIFIFILNKKKISIYLFQKFIIKK